MIDVLIMIFFGSICMLLSDNIIYSFWGIDIKCIVFLTIVIWGIIKIIQSTLRMFNFEQKKTLLFQIHTNISDINYIRLLNDVLYFRKDKQSIEKFKQEIRTICLKYSFAENEIIFEILDESEEKLFFTAYERYKKELRKRYSDKMYLSDTLKMTFEKLSWDFTMSLNQNKGVKNIFNISLVFILINLTIYVYSCKNRIPDTSIAIGIVLLLGIYYILIIKSGSFDDNINFILYILTDMAITSHAVLDGIGVCETEKSIILYSVKVLLCTMLFLQPINNINNSSSYLEKRLKTDTEITTRIWNIYVYKVYQKYRVAILWISLVLVIAFIIIQYAAIIYQHGSQDFLECIYESCLNYFTGSQKDYVAYNKVLGVAFLSQSVIAFFINAFFIVKIVEGIFIKKNEWNM